MENIVTLKNHLGACDIISKLATKHDRKFELSAMKFFTVSRGSLTSVNKTFAGQRKHSEVAALLILFIVEYSLQEFLSPTWLHFCSFKYRARVHAVRH